MEAKELMIGDWIRNDFGELQQIVEIRNDGVMLAYNDIYPYDKIEPIPITPEILKKNGFSPETYDDHILVLNEKSGEVIYYECEQNYGLTIDNQYSQIRELKIQYVHELQHALRLCEIDKEIEL